MIFENLSILIGNLQKGQDSLSALESQFPLETIQKHEEVANAILFLLSKQASYIHGAELVVDGGLTNTLIGEYHDIDGKPLPLLPNDPDRM